MSFIGQGNGKAYAAIGNIVGRIALRVHGWPANRHTGYMRRKWLLPTIILGIVLCDQLSKFVISSWFRFGEFNHVVPGFLRLGQSRNPAALLGHLKTLDPFLKWVLLVCLPLLLLAFIFVLSKKAEKVGGTFLLGVALVGGGCLGNLLDRIVRGYVIDFISIASGPFFNLADVAIISGLIIMIARSRSAEPS